MTVEELIKRLSEVDKDLDVVYALDEYDCDKVITCNVNKEKNECILG